MAHLAGRPCCRWTGMVNPGSTSIASRRGSGDAPLDRRAGRRVASLSIPWGFNKATTISAATIWSGRAIWSKRRAAFSPRRCRVALRVLGYLRSIQQPTATATERCSTERLAEPVRHWPGIRDGRMRLSAAAGRRVAPRGAPAARQAFRLPADDRARRQPCRAQRTRHRRGPLGRRCRLQPVHACRRDRRTACRGRPARRCVKDDAATYLRETADGWNDKVERWTYVTGTQSARRSASMVTTSASRHPTAPRPAPEGRAMSRSRTGLPAIRIGPPRKLSAPTRWHSSASVCGRPTIRG